MKKLSVRDLAMILVLHRRGLSSAKIAEGFDVSRQAVDMAIRRAKRILADGVKIAEAIADEQKHKHGG